MREETTQIVNYSDDHLAGRIDVRVEGSSAEFELGIGPLEDILSDRYILNRTTPSQLQRLLENPEVVRTLGQDTIESVRMSMTSV